MKIKSIILPLFAVFALAVSPVAVASECPLCKPAKNGDIAEVKRLLDGGANPNAVSYDGFSTALMYATFFGHAEIAKILLSAGANPNAAIINGETVLILATIKGHAEIAKMLFSAGANLDLADNNGVTALMIATEKGHAEFVKVLLESGANPNAVDNDGWTALEIAEHYGHTEVISILQNFRPSISPEDIEFAPFDENNIDLQDEIIKDKSEYAFRQFSAMSENEQAEFCISIRSPQRPCFCTTGIVCTKNYCIDRPNCVEPEDADYKHLLNDYTPSEKSAEESAAEEPTNESAADESSAEEPAEEPAAEESPAEEPAEEIAEEPAEPETKTVCRAFANGINPDNTQWGRIGASEAGVGETEYAAIRAAIRICENDGLTECQTDLEVECEEVLVQ